MIKKISSSIIVGVIIAAALVYAYTTVQISAPTAYSTQASTGVNVSCAINVSAFPYLLTTGFNRSKYTGQNFSTHTINITILNKSSSAGAYGILPASLSLTVIASNNTAVSTFWNYTATLTDGDRHWLGCNFTNVSRNDDGSWGGALTSTRIIDIDADKLTLSLGALKKINFTLGTGTISIAGGMSAASLSVQNMVILNTSAITTSDTCVVQLIGQIKLNGSADPPALIWCDGDTWKTI